MSQFKPANFLQGQGIQTLAIAGTPGDRVTIDRKNKGHERFSFVVSNIETVASAKFFYICSTDGYEAIPVFPQTSQAIDSDTVFLLKNPGVATCQYVIGETFSLDDSNSASTAARSGASGGGGGGGGGGGSSGGFYKSGGSQIR